MRLKAHQLDDHLAKGRLAPVYFFAGDETLIVSEACDAVLQVAREQGFVEREVMHVDRQFNWDNLIHSSASMSLFAERRVLDIRIPDAKIDKDASAVLREYLQNPPADILLVLRSGRIDYRQRQSAWAKAIDGVGVFMEVWPVTVSELPRWLKQRLRAAGLSITPDALTFLAERVEGNLLAAVQEIAKLKLADLPAPIDLDALMAVLEDSSHYDVFEMLDAVMMGDGKRVSRMLAGLNAEGVSIFALLGALNAQLRSILSGGRPNGPPQRQKLVEVWRRRHGIEAFANALAEAVLIESQGKGVLHGDAWQSLERLCLNMAAEPAAALPSIESQRPHLLRG